METLCKEYGESMETVWKAYRSGEGDPGGGLMKARKNVTNEGSSRANLFTVARE